MLGNSRGLGNQGKGGQVQVRRCDGGVGGVRGDHSRYSEVSCACVCLFERQDRVFLFSPERCLKLDCMSLNV